MEYTVHDRHRDAGGFQLGAGLRLLGIALLRA